MAFNSSEGLFHATTTAIQDFSLLWNHHCSCGTNVRGFFGPSLPTNLHPHEHVFIPSLIFINRLKGIIYLLPTIYVPMNQQDMLYPRKLYELARYALPTNIDPHDLE